MIHLITAKKWQGHQRHLSISIALRPERNLVAMVMMIEGRHRRLNRQMVGTCRRISRLEMEELWKNHSGKMIRRRCM